MYQATTQTDSVNVYVGVQDSDRERDNPHAKNQLRNQTFPIFLVVVDIYFPQIMKQSQQTSIFLHIRYHTTSKN